MSKSPMPSGNHPAMLTASDPLRAAQLATFFDGLVGLASHSPESVFKRLENAVQGKSLNDAVFIHGLVSRLLVCLAPETDFICTLAEHYHEEMQKEVTPC